MKRLSAFSQNFIRSPQLVKELLGHTSIGTSDTVYDIGAGSGVVTSVLAKRCQNVVAVEIDPRMAAKLRANMQPFKNVTVYEADVLTMPLPATPYKVFANIPFSLSASIVRKLTESPFPPEASYLIVQKEFANKLLPDSDRFTNQMAITIGVEFAMRIRRMIKPSDFVPAPRVAAALLEIVRRPEPLVAPAKLPMFRQFVTNCFTDPRKFEKYVDMWGKQVQRPSQLRLDDWVELFAACSQ